MRKELTEFGKKLKIALVEKNQTQDWLIENVKKETNLYFDSSYLHKIITGSNNNPNIIAAINKILNIN